MKKTCVYNLASKSNDTVFFIGVISELVKRVHQHNGDDTEGFTANNSNKIVYKGWIPTYAGMTKLGFGNDEVKARDIHSGHTKKAPAKGLF
jgi:predicted GIY-YIG superfamily endonuclease